MLEPVDRKALGDALKSINEALAGRQDPEMLAALENAKATIIGIMGRDVAAAYLAEQKGH